MEDQNKTEKKVEKKTEKKVEKKTEKKVKLFIERGASNEDPNLFVSVNGVNYVLPKGVESEVPEAVYNEVMRSRRAQNRYDKRRDALLAASQESK